MYRFKMLTGRRIDTWASEVAVRVGLLNRIAELARSPSTSPKIMIKGATSSSRLFLHEVLYVKVRD